MIKMSSPFSYILTEEMYFLFPFPKIKAFNSIEKRKSNLEAS